MADAARLGTTAKSTTDCRKMDATGIVAFRQADVGEYLRDGDTPLRLSTGDGER